MIETFGGDDDELDGLDGAGFEGAGLDGAWDTGAAGLTGALATGAGGLLDVEAVLCFLVAVWCALPCFAGL